MDFASPPEVVEAIQDRAAHPIYGYTNCSEEYYRSFIEWMKRRDSWDIKKEWIVFSPGVVPALNLAVLAYTQPGDKIIVQPPVYYPFESAVRNNGRQLVKNPLVIQDGRYTMAFDDLEKKIDERTKLLILCSPHNPVGRVWTTGQLSRLVAICAGRGIVIVSDEIPPTSFGTEFIMHGDCFGQGGSHNSPLRADQNLQPRGASDREHSHPQRTPAQCLCAAGDKYRSWSVQYLRHGRPGRGI
jgi:bifunctional pyridoxal-dependent enzyme with beta-cystathionase and maltose regulon repressor activities